MFSVKSSDVGSRRAQRAAFEAFNRGVLLSALGETSGAIAAFDAAVRAGHHDISPKAAFNMAIITGDDLAATTTAYRIAIDSGHHDVAPRAAFNLGCALEQQGLLEDARLALKQAIELASDEYVAINATVKLERLGRGTRRSQLGAPRPRAPLITRRPHHTAPTSRNAGHSRAVLTRPRDHT
jgi:tetratricopeptide (TPR) repeat protein